MSTTNDKDYCTDLNDVDKNSFEQMKNKAIKIGYADGVNDGRESVFQNGFDQGYKDGLTTSFDIKKFSYFFKHMNPDKTYNKDLVEEKEKYKTVSAVNLKTSLLKDHSLNTVLQEFAEEARKKVPVASNLLNVQTTTVV